MIPCLREVLNWKRRALETSSDSQAGAPGYENGEPAGRTTLFRLRGRGGRAGGLAALQLIRNLRGEGLRFHLRLIPARHVTVDLNQDVGLAKENILVPGNERLRLAVTTRASEA